MQKKEQQSARELYHPQSVLLLLTSIHFCASWNAESAADSLAGWCWWDAPMPATGLAIGEEEAPLSNCYSLFFSFFFETWVLAWVRACVVLFQSGTSRQVTRSAPSNQPPTSACGMSQQPQEHRRGERTNRVLLSGGGSSLGGWGRDYSRGQVSRSHFKSIRLWGTKIKASVQVQTSFSPLMRHALLRQN